jgi:hypothetical protein
MNGCSLDDAFQALGSAPSPGCASDYATKTARREERRKARRCKGPLATYLDIGDKDPDRQHLNKLPEVPAMNPAIGMREHVPADAPTGSLEPFVPRNDGDMAGDYVRAEIPMNIPGTTEAQKPCPGRKKFFGADPDGDTFADYIPDANNYRLQPDFASAFEQQAGVGRAGSAATASLPNPSVNMYWKPTTASGAQTAFIEQLPPPGGKYYQPPARTNGMNGEISNDDIMKKLDKLWTRLDDMNQSSPEQVTSELLMFISSGIFVLFFMDLLVKKGSTLKF